ncbi:MAG TPA: branched-chain amino acid ABC transporter permease [Chloroflexota bacterium]|nr:branched-chain amino acid ABC transporter permease [Chloroflexota bacterium]
MDTLAALVLNGFITGAIYAVMALGFALIYNTTRVFHIAHGAVFTLAGYGAFLARALLPLAWVPAVVFATIAGILIEVLVYAPIRRRSGSLETYFIASLGVYFIVQNALQLVFGTEARQLRSGPFESVSLGVISVSYYHLLVLLVAVVAFTLVQLVLTHTRTGKAIRALADNPGLTAALGIDPDRLQVVVFALGSALAGLGAYLLAFDLGVRPDMGLQILLIAAISVILGGVGYLPGAIIGGFLLGLLQSLVLLPLSSVWQNVVTFAVLILVLLFRPQGLFGGRLVTRRA